MLIDIPLHLPLKAKEHFRKEKIKSTFKKMVVACKCRVALLSQFKCIAEIEGTVYLALHLNV